jgi:3-deoxy-D-manno-octulosonate 8-phosphate phosphatase (KDO 8-P phosphatase)
MINKNRLKKIRMLIMDVDGTLTDGKLYFSDRGDELKTFNVKDGYAISKLDKIKVIPVFLTGRYSRIISIRAKELKVTEVYQNKNDKIIIYDELKKKYSISDDQIAYIGDDVNDLDLIKKAGISFSVNNCSSILLKFVDYVSNFNGGEGAVREIIDILFKAKDVQYME